MSSCSTLTGRNGALWINPFADGIDGDIPDCASTAVPDVANAILRTTQWAVNPTLATSSEWGDSEGAGYTNRREGRNDATFTCEGKYDTTVEVFDIFEPEDYAGVALFLTDAEAGEHWTFPRAMCTDFNITVNVDTEEVIGWTSSWGADGPFYYPGEAGNPAWNLVAP